MGQIVRVSVGTPVLSRGFICNRTCETGGGGEWYLAKDGDIFWDRGYTQLWRHFYIGDGNTIVAITAPAYGRWTFAVDNTPWISTFDEYLTDPVVSPDGTTLAAVFKDRGTWGIVVNDKAWETRFDMAFPPVFSPDGDHVAAKVEKDGRYYIAIDGKILDTAYKRLENPVFSPDSSRILIRGMEKEKFTREVIDIKE